MDIGTATGCRGRRSGIRFWSQEQAIQSRCSPRDDGQCERYTLGRCCSTTLWCDKYTQTIMTFPLARHHPLIQNESKTSNHHQSAYPASADMRYVKTAAYCASRGCIQYMFALQDRVHDDPWRRDATRRQPESVIPVTHNLGNASQEIVIMLVVFKKETVRPVGGRCSVGDILHARCHNKQRTCR